MEDLQSILLPGIDSKRPIIIAGPCSAETEEQVMTTAKSLAERGIKIFRAGIWKPRTKPGGFEGIGVEGLAWLKHVKEETGMYTATEVATERIRSIKTWYRHFMDRSTHDRQSLCGSRNSQRTERCRHSGTYQESGKSRPRTMDRGRRTHL